MNRTHSGDRLSISIGQSEANRTGRKNRAVAADRGLPAVNRLDPTRGSIALIHDGVGPLTNRRVFTDNDKSVPSSCAEITTGRAVDSKAYSGILGYGGEM